MNVLGFSGLAQAVPFKKRVSPTLARREYGEKFSVTTEESRQRAQS